MLVAEHGQLSWRRATVTSTRSTAGRVATHPPSRLDVHAGPVALECRMLDERDKATGHESAGPYGRARARHLGHLDNAASGRDLDSPARPPGDDLERLRALSGIDHSLDPIALHAGRIARLPADSPVWRIGIAA